MSSIGLEVSIPDKYRSAKYRRKVLDTVNHSIDTLGIDTSIAHLYIYIS